MSAAWLVLLNVTIAAFVGGFTNHIAIKMLFHPRRAWNIGGRRVPFTPGLIPKRKEEIGRSLGRVVSDYLVTSHGMAGMLEKPAFRERAIAKLLAWLDDWSAREETVAEFMLRYWEPQQVLDIRERLAGWLRERTRAGALALWDKQRLSELKIGELMPGWDGSRKEELVQWGTDFLLGQIREELESPRGDAMIRQLTSQFMDQAGGFLGALAGMFMDADRLTGKVKAALVGQLYSPALQRLIADFIRGKLSQAEQLTLEEVIRFIGKTDEPREWVAQQAAARIDWDRLLADWSERRLCDLLGPHRERLGIWLPQLVDRAVSLLAANMDTIFRAISLPAIVEEEVRKFPIERLEEIILSVSGKEFAAITWLGVLLGAIIGLGQSLFLIWTR